MSSLKLIILRSFLHRCTALYGVPTMFIDMLNLPDFDQYDLTSLYTGVMAGSPCPIQTMRQVIDKLHMDQVTVWDSSTLLLFHGMGF